nr:MAG TPA: hypothetical protein [Caudoviricetes sp.]
MPHWKNKGNNSHHPDRRGKCGRRQAASVCGLKQPPPHPQVRYRPVRTPTCRR